MPFYSQLTLFEQSINHYFRPCMFACIEFCVIVFSWVPFCLVPFHAVPNNRTAILVCPFWKAVDITVVSKPLNNFGINSNSKMAFVLNFHFDWCLFWCYAILVCPALKLLMLLLRSPFLDLNKFQMKGCFL